MPRNLNEIFTAWGAFLEEGAVVDVRVNNLQCDSRKVQPGDAFVALAGAQVDGLEFADKALRKGAVTVLYDPDGRTDTHLLPAEYIAIPELNQRLGELASRFYGAPDDDMQLVAVTGTNGKTSVAHFIAQVWQQWQGQAGFIGTLGAGPLSALSDTGLTTPDVLQTYAELARLRAADISLVAMEVSSHALTQGRVDLLAFDIGVFTNLSHEHLDYHGDMQAYADAKRQLFSQHKPRFAVLNIADPVGRQWQTELDTEIEVVSYCGVAANLPADVSATEVEFTADGLSFRLNSPWGSARVSCGLLGHFNLDNLLAVAASLGLLGMPFSELCQALELVQPVPGRMQKIQADHGQPLVIVDYAHTPAALEQALQSLRPHADGLLFCVFGCGGERDQDKRPLMAAAVEEVADRVYLTSDNPRSEDPLIIINQVSAGFELPEKTVIEPDRSAAIRMAIYAAGSKDIVLIAGKGHENYQQIGDQKLPFDDSTEARLALGRISHRVAR